MKLPVPILREFVQSPLSDEAIGDLLTMAGFELEGIELVNGDNVLEIKVVSNRGDGLSALGLAREILAKDPESNPTALYDRAVARFPIGDESTALEYPVEIQSPDCTRFSCRKFANVKNGPSPEWLQKRLTQAGMRPISLLVDLSNYVMLEIGQPTHAYDANKIRGGKIVVKRAGSGTEFVTLDEARHTLSADNLMICDSEGPLGVAGVMGGAESEVSESTQTVLLESANFLNTSVRKTRKQLNLNTDASYRFERSVDPLGTVAALNRFVELYRDITGADCEPGVTDVIHSLPSERTVSFRVAKAQRILGVDVSATECARYLTRLGFGIDAPGDQVEVKIPSWRPDVTLEEDLIEEVGRVHGYEKIPEWLPTGTSTGRGVKGLYSVIDTAKKSMLRCGLDQVVSHSLRDLSPLDFNPIRVVQVRNPHSPEMASLRSSLLPGLAEAALRNGGRNVHLFEIGRVFVKGDYQIDESPELSILITGTMQSSHFAAKEAPIADFWTLKGIIEELGHLIGDDISFDWPRIPDRRFHPTRQAGVLVDNGKLWVGTMGQIHPDVAEQLGLPAETYMAEVDLLVFFQNPDREIRFTALSRNPAVRRDIAVEISKEVKYRDIEAAIGAACGELLESQTLTDIYEGTGITAGAHSLTIALQIRKMNANLTDEEANQVRDKAVEALAKLGGNQR